MVQLLQYSTDSMVIYLQYGTVQYGTVHYSMVEYGKKTSVKNRLIIKVNSSLKIGLQCKHVGTA